MIKKFGDPIKSVTVLRKEPDQVERRFSGLDFITVDISVAVGSGFTSIGDSRRIIDRDTPNVASFIALPDRFHREKVWMPIDQCASLRPGQGSRTAC